MELVRAEHMFNSLSGTPKTCNITIEVNDASH